MRTFTENDTVRRCSPLSEMDEHSRYCNIQTAYHYEGIHNKSTRHHELGTTINVFKVILLASISRKSLDNKSRKVGSQCRPSERRTVPSSIYTAVPQAAMKAPTSHMIKDTPTLPDNRRMLLGVAYILLRQQSVRTRCRLHRFTTTHPVPITRLKIRNAALKRPTEWLLLTPITLGSSGDLT